MTDTITLLGPEELAVLLTDIIEGHPDNLNPAWLGQCLYTDRHDPERHCLIGQLAVEQGWELPVGDSAINHYRHRLDWPVTDEGWQFLDGVQKRADHASQSLGDPWSTLLPLTEGAS